MQIGIYNPQPKKNQSIKTEPELSAVRESTDKNTETAISKYAPNV